MSTEIVRRTAAALADDLAAGRVTSTELTEAHLDRIDALLFATPAFYLYMQAST